MRQRRDPSMPRLVDPRQIPEKPTHPCPRAPEPNEMGWASMGGSAVAAPDIMADRAVRIHSSDMVAVARG